MLRTIAFLIGVALAGCGGTASSTAPVARGSAAKGAAQLWAEQCMRCHNMRSPSSLSDAEWDVAMQHMRIRANLTAADSVAIREFLKSAN